MGRSCEITRLKNSAGSKTPHFFDSGPATFGHDNYLFHVMHVVDPTVTWGPTAVATAKEFVEFMATHYPAEIAAAAASPGPII